MIFKNKRYLLVGLIIVVIIIVAYLLFYQEAPKEQPRLEPIKLQTTTELTVIPKTLPTDNDLEIKQVYRADINGTKVEVPVETKENVKGVIKQEIDLTPILQMQKELDKKEFKRNWEVGTGIGIENGQVYIPIEIQRNYASNKAIAVEIHVKPVTKEGKLTGGELKHKWMF